FRPLTAFVVCGIAAGAMSFAIFESEPARDPMDAMALAPTEALIAPKLGRPATQSDKGTVNEPSVQNVNEEGASATRREGSIKSTSRGGGLDEVHQGDCIPVRVVRKRSPERAMNERPLISAVPIGHRDDPAVLAASPQTRVELNPLLTVPPDEPKATQASTAISVAEETRSGAGLIAEPTPPVSAPTVTSKKQRPRTHHAKLTADHDRYH